MRKSLLIILVFLITKMWAIDSNFQSYSVVDGLSNSSVKTIYQDKLGFIWFGTKDGLNRFDGNEFRIYRFETKNQNTAFNNDITCITPDRSGKMWVGTFDGVALFDPFTEQFLNFNHRGIKLDRITGVVTEIYIDKNQRIWISTKKGLFLVNPITFEIKTLLKGVYVSGLNECAQGSILIYIGEKGLTLIDTKSLIMSNLPSKLVKKSPVISKIYKDKKGRVWLGASTNNLFLFSIKEKKESQVNIINKESLVFNNEQIHCINELNDSTLILGTDKGLVVLELNNLTKKDDVYSIPGKILLKDDRIMSLFLDNENGLWVGTFNKGVRYYNPFCKKFNFYELKINPEIPVGIIGNLVENDGKLWIGHERGISSMDMSTGESKYYNVQSLVSKDKRYNESYFIFKKDHNQLCLYLLNNGLFILDLKNMRILNRINIPPTSQVRSMMKDQEGKIWIAEEDLSIYDPQNFTINNDIETNKKSYTRFTLTQNLLLLRNGNMLIGTRTMGVLQYIYQKKSGHKYSKFESLSVKGLENKNISTLFEDSKRRIWIGTYGSGLFCYDTQKKQVLLYNEANGLSHNLICGILEDNVSGDIWVSTVKGVSSINTAKAKIKNYTFQNGFPLTEVSLHSFIKGSNGLFYVGGSNGIASFNPHLFVENPDLPKVQITAVQSLTGEGKSKKVNLITSKSLQHVVLNYSNAFFHIKFSALNYLFPKENKYAYKLDGFDKEWITTNRNDATYTNLTEGDYLFCVKACNNDGVWNVKYTTLSIKVLPPIWRTWWAKTLYFIFILGFLYFILQYLIFRRTYKYKLQIDQIEKDNIEKNYQMKISLFTNFSHELRTPLTLIVGPIADMLHDIELPEKFNYSIQLINKNANRLLLLVNQLMDFRKLENGAMQLQVQNIDISAFMNDQIDSFDEFAQKKQIKITLINDYAGNDVWFDVSLMEKVIFNLISNALKISSNGDTITIRIFQENEYLIISVRDTGIGIVPDDLERIFDPFYQVKQGSAAGMFGSGIGLNFSKDIVSLHQGKIWATSIIGEGATFFVKLPLGNIHLKKMDLVDQNTLKDKELNKLLEKNSMSVVELDAGSNLLKNNTLVLVVEDDSDLRQYIKNQLSTEYTVVEAVNGKDGFDIAVQKLPDLIVSDIMMPLVSGIELCDQIKTDIRTAHIPVILLTAMIMNSQIQEGYVHGADDYILKPFDATLLKVRVQNLIESRLKLRKLFGNKFSIPDIEISELSSNDIFMQKLLDLIQKNVSNSEFNIEDICDEIGMSRAQLYRKIKVMTDSSPNKLIMQIRMKMALALFKTQNYNISDVAYQVGFSGPAYFSKYFKSVYNMTPSEFINKNIVQS